MPHYWPHFNLTLRIISFLFVNVHIQNPFNSSVYIEINQTSALRWYMQSWFQTMLSIIPANNIYLSKPIEKTRSKNWTNKQKKKQQYIFFFFFFLVRLVPLLIYYYTICSLGDWIIAEGGIIIIIIIIN